jgi:hypothetical protein
MGLRIAVWPSAWRLLQQAVGIYQLAGGLLGCGMVVRAWPAVRLAAPAEALAQADLILAGGLALFGLVVIAGYASLRNARYWLFSGVVGNAVQAAWIAGDSGSFYFAAGVVAGFAIRESAVVPVLRSDVSFFVSREPYSAGAVIGVNLAAVLLIVLLSVIAAHLPRAGRNY